MRDRAARARLSGTGTRRPDLPRRDQRNPRSVTDVGRSPRRGSKRSARSTATTYDLDLPDGGNGGGELVGKVLDRLSDLDMRWAESGSVNTGPVVGGASAVVVATNATGDSQESAAMMMRRGSTGRPTTASWAAKAARTRRSSTGVRGPTRTRRCASSTLTPPPHDTRKRLAAKSGSWCRSTTCS